jgi:hypothetical protein
MFKNRLIIPDEAMDLKAVLLKQAHDANKHYVGRDATGWHLRTLARVFWFGMDDDVAKYVASCVNCQFGKAATFDKAPVGVLAPTIPPHINHTFYVDLKGPLGADRGHIMIFVEAISRWVEMRYLPKATMKEVCEELDECIWALGTRPTVLRSDNGAAFNSDGFEGWCKEKNILHVPGIPGWSQGQGKVETRFRSLTAAIIATLGHKAHGGWVTANKGMFLAQLGYVINTTIVEPAGGSPYYIKYGHEPRTGLSDFNWTMSDYGIKHLGFPTWTSEDTQAMILAHHNAMGAVQGQAVIASVVASAITKRTWDASRQPADFKVGEWVLRLVAAPHRLAPYFRGPYKVLKVTEDFNFVTAVHYLNSDETIGPVHASTLIRFDASRATKQQIAEFHLEEGYFLIDGVIEHRTAQSEILELHLRWRGTPVTTWERASTLAKHLVVIEYCKLHGLNVSAVAEEGGAGAGAPAATGRKCGLCRQPGHNRNNCPSKVAETP